MQSQQIQNNHQKMRQTTSSNLDSTSDRSLTRINSWKVNLQNSLHSRGSYVTPTYSCNNIETKKSPFKKQRKQENTLDEITRQNKRLKREIDKLQIQVGILRKSQSQHHRKNSIGNQQLIKNNQKSNLNSEQCKKLRKLLEQAYYSIKKIQQQKNIILQENKKLKQTNTLWKQQFIILENRKKSIEKELYQSKDKHKYETDLLWKRLNQLEHNLKLLMRDYGDGFISKSTVSRRQLSSSPTSNKKNGGSISLSRHRKTQTKNYYSRFS